MGWPRRTDNWRDDAGPAQKAFLAVAKAIAQFEPVVIGADPDVVEEVRARVPRNVTVVPIPQNDSWFRDTAPMFLVREGTEGREVAGMDWAFNAWGGLYDDYGLDRQIGSSILKTVGVPRFSSDMVLEGGSVHVDGEGTLLTTEECLCHPNRNPGLSKADIEAELRARLGVSTIIWLPRGLVGDVDTNGHVDNLACFVRPGVVMLSWCEDPADPQSAVSAEALAVLEAATDAKGRKLQVVKLPLQPPMAYTQEEVQGLVGNQGEMLRTEGERLAGSYINYYICNGGVVMAAWGIPEADARAKAVMEAAFPDRKVVQVPTRDILLGGGNVHCITQQQPAGRPAAC